MFSGLTSDRPSSHDSLPYVSLPDMARPVNVVTVSVTVVLLAVLLPDARVADLLKALRAVVSFLAVFGGRVA